MLCSSLTVLLAACGGGSGTDASQTELLKSANANQGSNGYVSPDTSSTTTTAATTTTTSTDTTAPTTTTSTDTTITPTTTTSTYNYYVTTTGSDSNPGTQSAPFLTIQKASQIARPDTTIHVAPGTYTGNITTSSSGTASGHIRYVSDVKHGAKIVGTGTEIAWTNKGNYTEIDGFDISTPGRIGFYGIGSFGKIYNTYVHDILTNVGTAGGGAGGGGIVIYGSDWTIHNNKIFRVDVNNSAPNHVHGIYIQSANDIVYNNLIGNISGRGIVTWHAATKATIINNTVFNCLQDGILIGSGDSGQLPSGSQYNYVANNISINNSVSGIREYSEPAGMTSNNTYVNNLVYNNATNLKGITNTGDVITGNITAAPLFVNYLANGAGDYRLQAASPGIDKGTSTRAPSTDLGGTARPRGAGIDIGSYEY